MKNCITDCDQFNHSVLNNLIEVQMYVYVFTVNKWPYVWDLVGISKYFYKERRWDKGNEADEPANSQLTDFPKNQKLSWRMQILKTEKLYEFYWDPLVLLSIKVLVHKHK